jgi:hypothetical protein
VTILNILIGIVGLGIVVLSTNWATSSRPGPWASRWRSSPSVGKETLVLQAERHRIPDFRLSHRGLLQDEGRGAV